MQHMPALVSLVRCMAALCCIEEVVRFLDSTGGSRLFVALIRCAARCATAPVDITRNSGKRCIQLEEATISLLSQ
ncbi:unnamed protein product [Gongylonema pulchrum]|uniref:Secreted protein n=1 Tax=Gongylonema pulchrum TaxID=637853 RepID=A0A183DKC4_9BILA|nr:unnamed protein product [Gongylonema pulchrum]